eukprot:115228-Chlamydomonas_euryale.AAC.1
MRRPCGMGHWMVDACDSERAHAWRSLREGIKLSGGVGLLTDSWQLFWKSVQSCQFGNCVQLPEPHRDRCSQLDQNKARVQSLDPIHPLPYPDTHTNTPIHTYTIQPYAHVHPPFAPHPTLRAILASWIVFS